MYKHSKIWITLDSALLRKMAYVNAFWGISAGFQYNNRVHSAFCAKSQEEMSLYSTGSGILETEIVRIADGSCIK